MNKNIRVRVISDSYKRGKFYNEKVVVTDVTRPGYCHAISAKGDHLEGYTIAYTHR